MCQLLRDELLAIEGLFFSILPLISYLQKQRSPDRVSSSRKSSWGFEFLPPLFYLGNRIIQGFMILNEPKIREDCMNRKNCLRKLCAGSASAATSLARNFRLVGSILLLSLKGNSIQFNDDTTFNRRPSISI